VGASLWCTDQKKRLLDFGSFVNTEKEISSEASQVNGITQEMVTEFGIPAGEMIATLSRICGMHKVDYIVAHNGENFDRPMVLAEIKRGGFTGTYLEALPWIDTRTDIPFPVEPASRRLIHLAADHGFVNPFPHRALSDVHTMLRLLAMYDIHEVLAYQKIPFVTLQAVVSYDDRQLAKDARFSWENIGDKKYPKMWVKRVKQNLLELEKSKCKFEIRELKEK
jgi:DNA polymerase-3 subunit epsilon